MINCSKKIRQIAIDTIEIERQSLEKILPIFNDTWEDMVESIAQSPYPVIVTGIGKSGHVGRKIAATLASTGTCAHFIHATELGHGDLGNVQNNSHVIMMSFSGETFELLDLIPSLQAKHCSLISLTNHLPNSLSKKSHWQIQIPPITEACLHQLAPTSSTTCMLAIGDALAMSLMHLKQFTPSHFAKSHPSGLLGKKLTLKVRHVMKTLDKIPLCRPSTPLNQALIEMSTKNFGCILVINSKDELQGIITDGDLRRCLISPIDIHQTQAKDILGSQKPVTISDETLATKALQTLYQKRITALPVVNGNQLIGLCHLHDLLGHGF